ncbi:DUF6990 domain-containing protein [Rheinheimera faecalis]|uniref:DUF6990 domain-containing protein n=1 Tax=Rheinheimera faecalis TaxID=2901141 RepID=UPI001E3547BC|nr:hypothetical protein [Rheinheimera faecalis]
MKKAELIKYFKARFPAVNEGGGDWCFTLIDDETAYSHMRPKLGGTQLNQYIGISFVMNPRWFDELETAIFNEGAGTYLISTGDGCVQVNANGPVTEAHLEEAILKAKQWYQRSNTEEVLAPEFKRRYDFYNRFGRWQFIHIIACVLKGDVEKLQTYLGAFKRGDRMEFIPIIHQEYFERAIPLAKKYRSGELISPIQF